MGFCGTSKAVGEIDYECEWKAAAAPTADGDFLWRTTAGGDVDADGFGGGDWR